MRRSPKRYVRDDEIKFRLQGPKEGQFVKFRIYRNKTYITAIYRNFEFHNIYSDAVHVSRWVMGWVPLTEEEEAAARQYLSKKQEAT